MNEAAEHFRNKLAFETDAWDLNEMLRAGDECRRHRCPIGIGLSPTNTFPARSIFPHRKMNQESTRHLDRDALYVTYCDGIGCNASTKGALKLAELGFQVKELIGGIDWWKRDGYPRRIVW